jgi:DNA-binding NarL/FixJ family response regulator
MDCKVTISKDGSEMIIRISLPQEFRKVEFQGPKNLTARQGQVLECLRKRMQDKEIADHLNISTRTAKFHVSNILKAFKVSSRMDILLGPI